ncbi:MULTISPECIES: biopolymer transporter ExbD [unclassified Wenzhouxiangella]|uniref:ExbD/TolR family protein n=1 Tax=unclassified Wenzhouxiangella TaxID=2613841 RepID=UPI000E32C62D|nr:MULTISPECIES: biopolymer transporter ExbD [unclassified Wenzhouxiangella]RFF27746.1 biopolymer transporter ExbD [Wenzhouxiangella sp. 15181]RFP69049.1 biopolymer transporter ExbD [Wenzhouxiangella sp. 15190]
MARRHATRDEPEINITPMLDIVFIMLIFFIVTTSFIRETGVEVNKPTAMTAEPRPQGNVLIAIRDNDDIWMNKQQIELHEVRTEVERAKAENPESAVVLIADRGARTGMLVEVMDQVQAAGINRISVSAEPEDGR